MRVRIFLAVGLGSSKNIYFSNSRSRIHALAELCSGRVRLGLTNKGFKFFSLLILVMSGVKKNPSFYVDFKNTNIP
jgi:hypothetical protein